MSGVLDVKLDLTVLNIKDKTTTNDDYGSMRIAIELKHVYPSKSEPKSSVIRLYFNIYKST